MSKKISYNAIRWLCVAMMGLEIVQAINTRDNVILYSLHSLESTLWLLAFVYFLGKSAVNFTINNNVKVQKDDT